MLLRALSLALAAAIAATAVAPAHAQQFSESHQFLEAVRDEDGTKVTDILNKPGVRIINTKDRSSGEGALHIVVKKGNFEYLRFFLQRDANPNIQDAAGNTPLLLAVDYSFIEAAQILIKYKANVNMRNSQGETPLIRAVRRRNIEMVRTLLDAGADPDLKDYLTGQSARDYAVEDTRSPAIAKLLTDAAKIDNSAVAGPRL